MARGKNKKSGKRRGDDTDSDADNDPKSTAASTSDATGATETIGMSRKEKRAQKLKGKQSQVGSSGGGKGGKKGRRNTFDSDDDDEVGLMPQVKDDYGSDSDEEKAEPEPQPAKKLTKKQLKRQQEREAAAARARAAAEAAAADNSEPEGEEEEEEPQPEKKMSRKELKKSQLKEAAEARARAEARAQAEAEAAVAKHDEDEEMEEDEPPQPAKKLSKKELRKLQQKEAAEARARAEAEAEEAAAAEEADNDEDELDEEEPPQPVKKLTKKQLKKLKEKEEAEARAKAEDMEEEEDFKEEEDEFEDEEPPQPVKKLTKKQLKKLKQKEEAEARTKAEAMVEEEEELEEEEPEGDEPPQPVKKLTKSQMKKLKQKEEADAKAETEAEAAVAMASALEEDEEEEEEVPQPAKKLTKKQLKKLKEKEKAEAEAKAALFDDESSEEEGDVEGGEDQNLAEQMGDKLRIADDDDGRDGSKKKSKDKKKEKKEKKMSKLEKQMAEAAQKHEEEKHEEKKGGEENAGIEGDVLVEMDEEAKAKAARKAEKAARKAEKEEKKRRKAEKEARKAAKAAAAAKEADDDDDEGKAKVDKEGEDGNDEDEVFYGAPDDHAWTDKSHAHRDAESKADEGPDLSLIYGPDGKKLSNKERKRALKAKQAAERAAEFEASASKASAEGAQFACSQTAVNENDPQWQNSLDIIIPSFNISAAGKILFKDSPLNIGHGRRYGLVGPNGKGKSTMLKMIASRDLKLPPRIDFLYVEQEVVADDTPAVDAVLKADKRRWDLLEEEKVLTEEVDGGDEDPKKVTRLQKIYEELNQMGAEASEAKARRILYGLGFDVEMQTKPTKMFSGGWRMRISLARALFIEPTLLMLDEPTNHLDLNAVIWLDDYLQRWKKTLLVVSHDQDFLNSVCEEILHIEDLKLVPYKGNYDSFKKAEKTKLKQLQKAWEKQEKRLRELKRSGNSKAKATEAVKKSSKREPGARSQKKKNDAIASGAATAETTELIKRPREYTVKIEFSEVNELSRPVIEVNRVHFRYSPKHPVIFDRIDFGIDMDSRICVVGPNGAGKSTLLKLLTGEVESTKGEIRRNPRLRMGIYNQHFVDRLPMNKTPVEHLRDRFDDQDYQSVRNRLGKYGLEGHAHEVAMRDLSGGQKARVVFVELSLQRPHILLLDEPTNNLDIETIDALLDAINNFNGGIIVVTHDQRLIEECDCTLWVVEKQGVTRWDAGFDDYKESILRELEEDFEKEAAARREKLEAAAAAKAEKLARLAAKTKLKK